MSNKLIELNNSNFNNVVSNGINIVDFWAPWCGPCRMLSPILEKLSEDLSKENINVCKVNIDNEQDLATQFGIRSIPTILFIKDGKVLNTLIGSSSLEKIKDIAISLK